MTKYYRAFSRAPEPSSNLLLVTSNPCGGEAAPLLVARRLVEGLVVSHPGRALVVRDLDGPSRVAAGVDAYERPADSAAAQAAATARAGVCLDELFDADVVVLAVGVTRRSLSPPLKAWFERVMVPGLTFTRCDGRIDGLLHGKKVYLVVGVGGDPHPASPDDDFHEEYLRLMLKVMGLTDVEVIRIDEPEPGAAVWDKVAAAIEQSF